MRRLSQVVAGLSLVGVLGVSGIGTAESHQTPTRVGDVDIWFDHRDESATLPSKNLGDDILYQVFLDRFANGNPSNDCQFEGRFCDPSQQDWYRYWGGDMRGLIDRMGYLKDLGITKIWLTPIFENNQVVVRRQKHGQSVEVTSYHGYWIKD